MQVSLYLMNFAREEKFSYHYKSICMTNDCLRTAEMYKNSMNTAVHPCDDYFDYACANYPFHNQIPPHMELWSYTSARKENVDRIVLDYIKNINLLWPKGFQKVRTFYELCMNEDQRRQLGYDTLEQELTTMGMNLLPPFHLSSEPRTDFARILGKIHRSSVRGSTFLHRVTIWPFIMKMQLNTLSIGSINEPVSNEEDRLESPPVDPRITEYYQRYMTSVVNTLYDHLNYKLTEDMKREIKQRVEDVSALRISLYQMAKSFITDNVQTSARYLRPAQVKAIINEILEGGEIQINFTEYLETLYAGITGPDIPSIKTLLDDETFPLMITLSPYQEFEQTYKILRNTSSSVFVSLMWWTVVASIIEEGPVELYQIYRGYKATEFQIYGPPIPSPRPELDSDDHLGAKYFRVYNYVVIPIAYIQFPRWDLGLEVLHYATLGYTIAHEVGHSVDETGSTFNARGDRVHCLTDDAARAYSEIVDCFIEAFNNLIEYIPHEGFVRVNGRVSVDENMADWQGFNIGLMAYKKYVEKHGVEKKLPDIFSKFTVEQLYSLAYSQLFCVNIRDHILISTATIESHAPHRARVNGILKNSKQFTDAYMCSADAPMNSPKKCEIWF